MKIKLYIHIILGAVFLILTWLFVGFFRDDEFSEPNFFLKHRPTFKVNFYSPTGMEDFELSELSAEREAEQIAYNEFVAKQLFQNNRPEILWFLPFMFIQMTLTFFCFGILKMRRTIAYKIWQLPVHYAICQITTFLSLVFILVFDNLIATVFLSILALFINYAILHFLTKRNGRTELAKNTLKIKS